MGSTPEIAIAITTIVISAAALYVLSAAGRRFLRKGIHVRIVIGERDAAVAVEGSEIFRTPNRLKYRPTDGDRRPTVAGIPGVDVPKVDDRDALLDYDLSSVDQPASRGVLDAFIIACCWSARRHASALAVLGGVNVVLVLDLPEARRNQLERELNPDQISDATGARLSIEAAT